MIAVLFHLYLIQITLTVTHYSTIQHYTALYIITGPKVHSATATPVPQVQHTVTTDVRYQNGSFRGCANVSKTVGLR